MKETYQAAEPEIIVDDGGLYTMAAMYRRMLKKLERRVHVVFKKTQSIASRILEKKKLPREIGAFSFPIMRIVFYNRGT
jgi:hypothetical protein